MSRKSIPIIPQETTDEFPLTIGEWCGRLSQTDRRIEMISAFYSKMKKSGYHKNYAQFFAVQYHQFISQPA